MQQQDPLRERNSCMKLSRLSWTVWSRSFTAPCFTFTCSGYCSSPLSHPAFFSHVLCHVALLWSINRVPQLQWSQTVSSSHSFHLFRSCISDDGPVPTECFVSYGCYSLIGPFGQCEVGVTDEGRCCHG